MWHAALLVQRACYVYCSLAPITMLWSLFPFYTGRFISTVYAAQRVRRSVYTSVYKTWESIWVCVYSSRRRNIHCDATYIQAQTLKEFRHCIRDIERKKIDTIEVCVNAKQISSHLDCFTCIRDQINVYCALRMNLYNFDVHQIMLDLRFLFHTNLMCHIKFERKILCELLINIDVGEA